MKFLAPTPEKWRIVRNTCLFIVGFLAVIINAANQVPDLGIPHSIVVWLDLASGLTSFVALYAQGQGGGEPQ